MGKVITKESKGAKDTPRLLAAELNAALGNGRKVFWLVSGGSSLPVAVAALKLLRFNANQLVITLVDDKFLPPESTDSNAAKLQRLDFEPGAASYQPILCGKGLEQTTKLFAEYLHERLVWADFALGQFGLGESFHTGGILPHSPAAKALQELACGYMQDGIGHITVTPGLIQKLDIAFVNSTGEAKRPLVEHFLKSTAQAVEEPTQALKLAQRVILVSDVLPE